MSSMYGQHTILISYDLRKPDRNYAALYEAIKSYGAWARALESVWFIETSEDVEACHNKLKSHMDQNDGLVVVDLQNGAWWTSGIDPRVLTWMRDHIKVH